MNIILSSDKVKHFINDKLHEIELELLSIEDRQNQISKEYKDAVENYRKIPIIFRVFIPAPKDPEDDIFSEYLRLEINKMNKSEEYDDVFKLVSTIDSADSVALTLEDIEYYNISF